MAPNYIYSYINNGSVRKKKKIITHSFWTSSPRSTYGTALACQIPKRKGDVGSCTLNDLPYIVITLMAAGSSGRILGRGGGGMGGMGRGGRGNGEGGVGERVGWGGGGNGEG